MKSRWVMAAFVAMAISFIFVGLVSAHHSRAGYSVSTITLKGIVTSVSWRNPHIWVNFEVKDEAGKAVKWSGELSSTTTMLAAGLGRETLKPGDEIIVSASPADNGSPQGLIASIKRPDGTVVVADSYRNDTR